LVLGSQRKNRNKRNIRHFRLSLLRLTGSNQYSVMPDKSIRIHIRIRRSLPDQRGIPSGWPRVERLEKISTDGWVICQPLATAFVRRLNPLDSSPGGSSHTTKPINCLFTSLTFCYLPPQICHKCKQCLLIKSNNSGKSIKGVRVANFNWVEVLPASKQV